MMQKLREGVASVSWPLLSIISAVAVAFALVALWLGSNTKQIEINTGDLHEIKIFLNEVRQHDANTVAEQRSQDRRIDYLEKKLKQ